MRCYVGEREVPCTFLARREMNFSQPVPGGAVMVPYRVVLRTEELIEQMTPVFVTAADEDRADAPFHKKGEWPTRDRWEELGYPSPGELLECEPAVLEALVAESFNLEALDRFVPGPDAGLPQYLLNTLECVRIQDGMAYLEGSAFLHPQLAERSSTFS
jgi:hypothetical protein